MVRLVLLLVALSACSEPEDSDVIADTGDVDSWASAPIANSPPSREAVTILGNRRAGQTLACEWSGFEDDDTDPGQSRRHG